MMTRQQVTVWSGLTAITGTALLLYLLLAVPPSMPDGQSNTAALLLFFLGLMLLIGGFGSLVALALHNRWPVLAGVRDRRRTASPAIAMRQGALLALAIGVIVVLAYLRFLDMAFVFVSFVLIGLLEAFLQNRHR